MCVQVFSYLKDTTKLLSLDKYADDHAGIMATKHYSHSSSPFHISQNWLESQEPAFPLAEKGCLTHFWPSLFSSYFDYEYNS